jgi:hypothetical protein
LYICGAISRIPPSSGAVKEYLLNRLDGVFAEGEAKITSLEKKDDQWYFTFTKSSEKDELEGSGKVTVDFEAKNIVFGKYDLYAEYKVDLMKVKQGISEQEVMNSLYEYSQLEYDVVITPSETIQDNMTSAYVKGTGKGDNFVINIDSELQFVYESDYTYTERKWVCTNLDILSVTRTPITAIDDQSVITALQELLVAEGINGLIVSADERQKLKITDITIEQPQYDETFQNASLQVSHITITHPQYTSTGRASLDMYLSDGQWAISGSGFALETAANAPDKDELLLLMEGKEVNTEFGTLNFDKSKVSDVKDIEFIGDGSSYTVSFTADYHSDLFKTTGVFTVTLHWDITGGYRFIKASFIKDSIVLTNKSAFNSTFSSNYSAIEEYGIGTSGNISITFTDYSESNSLVSANVKIAGRKTQNEKTLHADLLISGITQLITVVMADKINKHQYIRSLKPLIA